MTNKKEQLLALVQANPFISQQDLAQALTLSRSAVAGHLAQLVREGRILGRAYVLPARQPILCVGGSNVDRKLQGLAPLQMGSSNPARQFESPGGVARNIAENLARLGMPVQLHTAVGQDGAGRQLLAQLQELGADCSGSLRAPDAATGSYTAVLDAQGELVLALAHMALSEQLDADFMRQRAPQRAAARLWVADLNVPRSGLDALREDARRLGRPLVLVAVSEPKMARLGQDLRGVDLLILNAGELAALLGRPLPDEAALQTAYAQLQALGLQRLVISRGAQGVLYSDTRGRLRALAAPRLAPSRIREVTGAGDALSAGIVAALHQRPDDLAGACRLGQRLATLTLQSEATVSPQLHPRLLPAPDAPPTSETD
jgi:pseudouridine kinase